MRPDASRLLQALRGEADPATWTGRDWGWLVQQARAAGLLARLASPAAGPRRLPEDGWPAPARLHLESARRVTQAQQHEVRREAAHVADALRGLPGPVVLLKGAAYVLAELPAADGRVFSDLDILVPKAQLPEAEARLVAAGWQTTHLNAYDQRYYREWMHELPPMQHARRGTTLDVHHTIVPETARLRTDARLLFDGARRLPGDGGMHVLAPTDMVLHSMTHLFMNDDMTHALRDLSDLDLLLRRFGTEADFWPRLVERARELDLRRPLWYGLRYGAGLLETPVPHETLRAMQAAGPPAPWVGVMDAIWRRALEPPRPGKASAGRALALFALYVRGHWLRMPPGLLARHLTVKALRLHERGAADAEAADPR